MQDFEKLGVFYLGREYDLELRKPAEPLLLYESKDLTTHAVCVGMTGSGKTGLCLSLLEEAAIDGIPAICIDPKGDLGNLMLSFPKLRPEDFRPWVDPADATRKGMTADEYAVKLAKTWKDGLAEWGQTPERIQRFRDSADVSIYTPGSRAGIPLTIMRSFAAPPAAILQDSEALRERISAAAAGLLVLMGIDADPLRSREHILLSNLFDRAWREGTDLTLADLIRSIQTPPFKKLGFIDLEQTFPAKDRFNFAMQLNNLLASPGFQAWMEGEPLDIQRLLYTKEGKPRLAIISIAHLTDSERMFFVTILLNEFLTWVRNQSGTSSLRAILYMDEVFGYFPPTANPPTKTPMLTLLKQARAFGVGIMLATQNPVDLDYKGLSNAGTWFLGRLQTERDKARVLDGLEGASASAGAHFDRSKMEKILSGLGNRVFLMNNVHDDAPVVFQTRWALNYLSGPVTREQIQLLMSEKKAELGVDSRGPVTPIGQEEHASAKPVLPPDVAEIFLPRRGSSLGKVQLQYRPGLLGRAKIHFVQASSGVDYWEDVSFLIDHVEAVQPDLWTQALVNDETSIDTETDFDTDARFSPLPSELSKPKTYSSLSTALKDHLYRTRRLPLFQFDLLKMASKPGESEGDFRARIALGAREERDRQLEKLRAKYGPKLKTLQEQLRKSFQRVDKEKTDESNARSGMILQAGASILGAVFGRKLASATTIGKAVTAARAAGRASGAKQDVAQAEENVDAIQQRINDLNSEFEAEAGKVNAQLDESTLALSKTELQPRKADISITQIALCWTPWEVDEKGNIQAAY